MASFTIGVLSVHFHGGTKENKGNFAWCPGRYSIHVPSDYECKLEPTCLDPNNYKKEIRTSVYHFREQCTGKCRVHHL